MTKDTLNRFREGIRDKRFSLTDVSRTSNIPLTTLADMLDDDWGGRVLTTIERLDSLRDAINGLERAA
ncbi:MAG: hypothetical protein AAFO91_09890 [Bacteroidota bacterium]